MQSWLKQQVATNEKGIAIRYEEESYTFSEVYNLVNKQQKKIVLKIKNQRRIALIGKNTFDMYLTILALWELNREIVFLNFRLTKTELAYQLKEADVQVVIGDDEQESKFFDSPFYSFKKVRMSHEIDITLEDTLVPTEIASIMFTSGTTGNPKGVIQKFEHHLASALATEKELSLSSIDEWLCVTPLIHISGLSIICRSLVTGLTVHLVKNFDVAYVTKLLTETPVTIISVVSVMLEQLIKNYPDQGYHSDFRLILVGGSSVPSPLISKCQERRLAIVQSFGMTETCSQVISLRNEMANKKQGSSGLPVDKVEIKINASPNELVGEIWLKGPQVITNYLKYSPSWTEDGWFKTGDLGYLDEDGYLFVKSRMKELIISGGENIYPAEIEHCVLNLSGVHEIAVVGKSDNTWGQIPIAFIVTDLSIEDVNTFASLHLAKFKLPKKWIKVDNLPKTTSGKVKKSQLMKEVELL